MLFGDVLFGVLGQLDHLGSDLLLVVRVGQVHKQRGRGVHQALTRLLSMVRIYIKVHTVQNKKYVSFPKVVTNEIVKGEVRFINSVDATYIRLSMTNVFLFVYLVLKDSGFCVLRIRLWLGCSQW